MDTFLKLLGSAVAGLFLIVFVALLLGFPVMWLWNWLMPVIFGLVQINIWKAIGLNLLCELLLRSFASTKSNK
jgi:hypothetical protein